MDSSASLSTFNSQTFEGRARRMLGRRFIPIALSVLVAFSLALTAIAAFYPAERLAKAVEKLPVPPHTAIRLPGAVRTSTPGDAGATQLRSAAAVPVQGETLVFLGAASSQHRDTLYAVQGGTFVEATIAPELTATGPTYAAIATQRDGVTWFFAARHDGLWRYRIASDASVTKTRIAEGHHVALAWWPAADAPTRLFAGCLPGPAALGGLDDALDTACADAVFDDATAATPEVTALTTSLGTLHAAAVDLDGNGDFELALARRGAAPLALDTPGAEPESLDEGQAMFRGIAAGDGNGDGRPEFVYTNEGSTYPTLFRAHTGDAPLYQGWAFLVSRSGAAFERQQLEAGIFNLAAGWGAVLADYDGDGKLDLLTGQNDPRYWVHQVRPVPSKVLLGFLDETRLHFRPTKPPLETPRKAVHSPLIGDFDGDGALDVIWAGGGLAWFGEQKSHLLVTLDDDVDAIGTKARWLDAQGRPCFAAWPSWLPQQGRGTHQPPLIVLPPKPKSAAALEVTWPGQAPLEIAASSVPTRGRFKLPSQGDNARP